MQFGIKEVLKNTQGTLIQGDIEDDISLFNISSDTRKIEKGDFYLPLRGENYAGHSFIDSAVQKGAIGYFTQDKTKVIKDAKFIIYVKNTLVAYLKLAKYIRDKINPTVIAITGSSGKTTVKEMLYSVLNTTYKTHKTILNHNNEIGLCQTMFQMPCDTQFLVLEMGMRNLGEIELLCKYSTPDIGIITNIGTAHVELLGNIENIARAKCEIASHLNKKGLFVAPDCDKIKKFLSYEGEKKYVSIDMSDDIQIKKGVSSFRYENVEYKLSIEGEHNIQNALLVIEASKRAGVSIENIKKGLFEFKPIEKRWEISNISGIDFINDSYNANPESMKAAIKTFLSVYRPPLVLVLGDMGELGENSIKYHQETGEFISSYNKKDSGIELLTVGELARFILKASTFEGKSFKTNLDCAKYIKENIKEGTTVLLKASRFMKFEELIEAIKQL